MGSGTVKRIPIENCPRQTSEATDFRSDRLPRQTSEVFETSEVSHYVNVERIDDTFIEQHWPAKKGLLFKVDEGGPGADLRFLGDDPMAYERAFEAETKSAEKGREQLVQFIKLINQTPDNEFAATLNANLEVDDFLRVTATLLFSGAFDQLTGWQPHNYYLYRPTKTDRWRYLPWDLDVGFSEVAFGRIQVLADWNISQADNLCQTII